MKIDIQKLCKKNKYTLILLAISIIIQTLISSIFPYLTKFIIDDILIKKTLHTLNKLSILIVFLIILNLSFNVLISYLCSKWTQDVIFSLRQEISQFFFNRIDTPKKNGLFINSILSDCELVGSQLLNILLNGLPNILLTVIYLIILLSLNKFLVLITFFLFPYFLLFHLLHQKKYSLSQRLYSHKKTLY
ncbi:hypothetical protein I568_00590 [Enterococcus columbae DSM 7374 = ATCC 51263]|uniref:ABC transmembrane type-1 domain-containing protein n=1 Tax=Enterococcus columbae DSM 7374 = ATCC 51263 TaxID=1121865 RepID=S0KWR5_9ENTE|nr:ABC transporter transmembrane domain-containing protein [Enterococcus columbae]EOT44558.1 hypothetical protein OMW_00614 [Enterococcus columbae DSM 7374 = ATCC 51263]EOW87546.1 hypothetical protein I568_00590 [Enterococcus columbae DSM 7374 = ATCC 51263]OJG25203.1 hypothetical protein RR47_GL001991 [Enterococcus columbae DSM 7374 = ATCC 51263]